MDELNQIIEKYLQDVEEYDFEDFIAIKKMSEIILSNRMPFFKDKVKTRYGLNKSINLAYSFLDVLGYGDYFNEKMKDGTFKFKQVSMRSKEIPMSYYNEELGKSEIYLPYSNFIIDAYVIVHELLHDTNLDFNNMSITRDIFTEYISMFGEFIFELYIKENFKINDFKTDINYSFNSCYKSALKVDFQLNLIKSYLENGQINNYFLNTIIEKYDPVFQGTLLKYCYSILEQKELDFDFYMRYLTGILLSCHSYELFLNNKFDLELFVFINDYINYLEPEDVYSYLNLKVVDGNNLLLSNDSYEKLNKSYKKIMNGR